LRVAGLRGLLLIRAVEDAKQGVVKQLLVALTQASDAGRCRGDPAREAVAQGAALCGEHYVLHSAVRRMRLTLDETARLQSVDQPRDVRRVALEPTGKLAHRHGTIELQLAERKGLRRRQLELGGSGAQVAVDPLDRDSDEESPDLVCELQLDGRSGNTTVHASIVVNELV